MSRHNEIHEEDTDDGKRIERESYEEEDEEEETAN